MNELEEPGVPAEVYTRDYYENCCQGYDEFSRSGGRELPLRLSIPLGLGQIGPGVHVLDIGCGRGEVALHCADKEALVWGLDYAWAAVELAGEAVNAASDPVRRRIALLQTDAQRLPLDDESMDLAYMLDVVEHLRPKELDRALQEARRVLKPGGKLIIHTMPNLWYYRFGYPIFRALQRLRGQRLPADPRERWDFQDVHVNEQTPRALDQTLRRNHFQSRVWLQSTQTYDYETSPWIRRIMRFLVSAPLIRAAFCNDIFALAIKEGIHREDRH